MWIQWPIFENILPKVNYLNDPYMTFNPIFVKVTCVTLIKIHQSMWIGLQWPFFKTFNQRSMKFGSTAQQLFSKNLPICILSDSFTARIYYPRWQHIQPKILHYLSLIQLRVRFCNLPRYFFFINTKVKFACIPLLLHWAFKKNFKKIQSVRVTNSSVLMKVHYDTLMIIGYVPWSRP